VAAVRPAPAGAQLGASLVNPGNDRRENTLELQAEIADNVRRPQLAENLRRGAS
jgi:hypothetical protein